MNLQDEACLNLKEALDKYRKGEIDITQFHGYIADANTLHKLINQQIHTAAKNEKIRLNEVGPGEIENPELREIINKSVRGINELQTQFERFRDGKISIAEVKKLCRKTDKKIREIRLMLKEYEERKA